MEPWLTVVVPVHEGETYLGATLDSIIAENPEGVEIRLYNSGDDGGAARRVADRFSGKLAMVWQDLPEIKPWTAKTNLGVAEARTPYVAMLHQDDLWLPGHLGAVRKAITDHPGAALSIAPSRFAAPDGRLIGDWRLPFAIGRHSGKAVTKTLLVQNTIAIPSPVISRDAWVAVGGMDELLWYTADWDLYLKLARAGDVLVRDSVTTAFRIHGGSLTMTGSRDVAAFREQLNIVLDRHIGTVTRRDANEARASIAVNCALAGIRGTASAALWPALASLVRLGPAGFARYLHKSRLIDRVLPRLRLGLVGAL